MQLRQKRPYWQSWRSDDGGETWRLLDPRAASLVAVHPLNPDIVYLGLGGTGDMIEKEVTGLFVSRDGGKTWLDANRGTAFILGRGHLYFQVATTTIAWSSIPRIRNTFLWVVIAVFTRAAAPLREVDSPEPCE